MNFSNTHNGVKTKTMTGKCTHILTITTKHIITFLNRTDLEAAELLQQMAETGTVSKTRSRASQEHPNGKCIYVINFYN